MKKLFLVLGGVLILGGCGLSADDTTSQSADKIGTTANHALQKVDGAMDSMEQTVFEEGNSDMEPFMTGDQYPVIAPEDAMMGDMMEEKKITYDDVSKHATKDDCWFVVGTTVYDVTPFIAKGIHPGKEAILAGCGKDATMLFESRPMGSATPHSQKAREMIKNFKIGVLVK